MKWCSGSCGRLLPLSEFHVNLRGNPQGCCKACHRIKARESYRTRYRRFNSASERERKRREYATSKEAIAA